MTEVGEKDPEFLKEVWGLYGIGCFVLLLRFVVRIKTVGFRGLQGDDLFALLVLCFYTMDAVTVHIIYFTGTNIEAGVLQQTRNLTSQEVSQFEYGSKIQLVAWYSYTALIWCLKGTMIYFFKRMTIGLWQQRLVNWLSIACVVSYISVFLTITLGCRPFQGNWQVFPDPGTQCTFKFQNFIVTTVMNVLTDAALLSIPLPLLWKLQIPLRRKLIIGVFLSSGLFVISAALIRCILTLSSNPSTLNINRWGVRETIVGIITVNVPILRPLFIRSFWQKHDSSSSTSGLKSRASGTGKTLHGPFKMASSTSRSQINSIQPEYPQDFGRSSEELVPVKGTNGGAGEDASSAGMKPSNGQVLVQTMVHVASEANDTNYHGGRDPQQWSYGGETKSTAYSTDGYV